jgi:hypothetical protein
MSDLLKESIADAKAVRETALANAKTFLEENFAASMKEMFAEKLKEEMAEEATTEGEEGEETTTEGEEGEETTTEGEEGEEGKIEKKLASSGIVREKGNVASKQHAKNPSPAARKQEFFSPVKAIKNLFEEEPAVEDGTEVTSEELDEILAELESEVSEAKEEETGETEKEETDETVNLDELLAELEIEEDAPQGAPAVDQTPVTPAPVPPQAPAAVAPVAGQVPSPSEEVDCEESVTAEEMAEALVAINEENETLKAQLVEHENTVKYLKGVLSETNLLNAKLLYTNKLFKGKNLTEEQKLKVINTFDLTKNIREVKLAYTVLAESINSGVSVAKKKTNATAQTITEGLASKPVSSTKPDATIVAPQASDLASRLQKLAGITK